MGEIDAGLAAILENGAKPKSLHGPDNGLLWYAVYAIQIFRRWLRFLKQVNVLHEGFNGT